MGNVPGPKLLCCSPFQGALVSGVLLGTTRLPNVLEDLCLVLKVGILEHIHSTVITPQDRGSKHFQTKYLAILRDNRQSIKDAVYQEMVNFHLAEWISLLLSSAATSNFLSLISVSNVCSRHLDSQGSSSVTFRMCPPTPPHVLG